MPMDHVHVTDLLDYQHQLNHCNHYDDLCTEIHAKVASRFVEENRRKSFVIYINQKQRKYMVMR